MVLETPAGWVITDNEGAVVRRLMTLDGHLPIDIGLIPNTDGLVFTAKDSNAQPLLYSWDGKKATLLSRDTGYHATPSVSPDGKTVVFVHHPGPDSGPVGLHGPGANAQLWSISLVGGNLAHLTTTPGCKGFPHFANHSLLLYSHNTCNGQQGLESMRFTRTKAATEVLIDQRGHVAEPRLSPNGSLLAYSQKHYTDTRIIISHTKTPTRPNIDISLKGQRRRHWLQWSADSRYVFLVNDCNLLQIDTTGHRSVQTTNICPTDGGLP